MDYITLGKNVRKYRLILGFSQEELAGKCDCSNSHIGQIENARGIPSLDMVVRIANSLSVTVDQLRGNTTQIRKWCICGNLQNALRNIRLQDGFRLVKL